MTLVFSLRVLSATAAIPLVLAGAGRVRASENYPAIVDRRVEVECPNPLSRCLICHTTAAGGEGTANQRFAVTLRDYGLDSGKAGRELAMALQELSEISDSDGDGATDLEELAACMNPSGAELGAGPGFGCNGARMATARGERRGAPAGAAWLIALLALVLLGRSRPGLWRAGGAPHRHQTATQPLRRCPAERS